MRKLWASCAVVLLIFASCSGNDTEQTEIEDGYANQDVVDVVEELFVRLAIANDEFLSGFDGIVEFNYNYFRVAHNGLISDFNGGNRFTIWSNQDMRNFWLMTVGSAHVSGQTIFAPSNIFEVGDVFVGDALLLYNHVSYSSFGRHGFSFIDDSGVRRYYTFRQGHANNNWVIAEFENRTDDMSEWWQQQPRPVYTFESLIAPTEPMPNAEWRTELLAAAGISEYGFNAAVAFLSGFDTFFEPVFEARFDWGSSGRVPRGYSGRIPFSDRGVLTYDRPDIVLERMAGFFDRNNNKITEVPWLFAVDVLWEDASEGHLYYHAHSFYLFDFDGSGIPFIIVNFLNADAIGQRGDTGSIFIIYRYIDGEYRLLEQAPQTTRFEGVDFRGSNIMGEELIVFEDDLGRLIFFTQDWWVNAYQHVVFDAAQAVFYEIASIDFDGPWGEWSEHHWRQWGEDDRGIWSLKDSWINHSPTIFGTDIGLTLLHPFNDLRDEMMVYLLYIR